MNLNMSSLRRYGYLRVRRLGLFAAALALLAMGVVTVAETTSERDANGYGSHPVVVATRHGDETTSTGVQNAGPQSLEPAWQGQGWPGAGPFHGGGWPGQ
jgi:hypothetical protein